MAYKGSCDYQESTEQGTEKEPGSSMGLQI